MYEPQPCSKVKANTIAWIVYKLGAFYVSFLLGADGRLWVHPQKEQNTRLANISSPKQAFLKRAGHGAR